jgi:hypothetical protein
MNLKNIKKEVSHIFGKQDLDIPIKDWIWDFISRYQTLYNDKGLSDILFIIDKQTNKSYNYNEAIAVYASIFADREIFLLFLDFISEPLKKGTIKLSQVNNLSSAQMTDITGIKENSRQLKFFPTNGYYWNPVYAFPPSLKKIIQKYLGAFDYSLEPLDTIKKTDIVYNASESVFQDFNLLITYFKQNPIPTTKQGRPSAAALKQIAKATKIKDFYPNEKGILGTLKILLSLLLVLDASQKSFQKLRTTEAIIDHLLKNVYIKKERNSIFNLFFQYGGIYKHISRNKSNGLENKILLLLKKLPINGWLSFDNVFNFFISSIDIEPIAEDVADTEIYFYAIRSRSVLKLENPYFQYVQKPFVKATFFMFAALGLVDIAYDENPEIERFDKDVTNPYEKLKYVRLNDFGAYILGLKKDYVAPEQAFTNELYLSSEALVITTNEDNTTAEIILKNYMTKVSNTRYVTDYEAFLSSCLSINDIQLKINGFKEALNVPFPANWEDFFKEIITKTGSLQGRTFKTYEIKKNPELIRLIARDEVLKDLIIKAEDYHILIKTGNLPLVQKRLLKFGYFFK